MANDEEITQYNILEKLSDSDRISQRQLSSQLGINVASINFAIKKLTKRGLIKVLGTNPRKIRYILTSKGITEKTQIAYNFLNRNFRFYKAVRKDVESKIQEIPFNGQTRVALYGVTDLMEIAYLVIQDKELDLVAVVDDEMKIRIFGYHVIGLEEISTCSPDYLLLTKEPDIDAVKKYVPDSVKIVDIRV